MEFKKMVFIGERQDSLGLQLAGIDKTFTLKGKEALDEVIVIVYVKC